MSTDILEDAATRAALQQAAEFRLIGLLFERPSESRSRHGAALVAESGVPELRKTAGTLLAIESPDYDSLFGPGGPASPREAAYIGRRDPARAMAEAGHLYEAFGFRPVSGEPPDHVASETGFAAYLWLKEAYALARGDGDAAGITRAAREKFFEDHLSVVAGGMATRLAACPVDAWTTLAERLLALVGGRRLTEDELDGIESSDEMACGACGDDGEGGPPAV
ncbi:MAG: molecular chaperone TorD family protein [Candidatus Brocadiae bacterium]|nr:molecular chaperone TorD family protein [Candidatus Brocadiia bacterium]